MHTPQTTRPHPRRDAGFTLVELLIVMSVILILMSLAIPGMQAVIRSANEKSAIKSLQFLNTEEGQYNSDYPQRGFSCSLPSLGGKVGSAPPGPDAAQLIPDDLATGIKSGYTFAIVNCTKTTSNNVDMIQSYELTAVPNSIGHSGNRGYCLVNDQIRYDPKGGTNCTEPL